MQEKDWRLILFNQDGPKYSQLLFCAILSVHFHMKKHSCTEI